MATTPTQLPVPSEKPQDLKFNSGKIDEFVTSLAQQYIDRLGGKHYTIEGLKQLVMQQIYDLGWNPVGTFQGGVTVANPGDIVQDTSTGAWYRWDNLATLPKTVPAGSIPGSAGGTGEGKWQLVDVSDVLRKDLAAHGGAKMIGSSGGKTVQDDIDMLSRGLFFDSLEDAKNSINGDQLYIKWKYGYIQYVVTGNVGTPKAGDGFSFYDSAGREFGLNIGMHQFNPNGVISFTELWVDAGLDPSIFEYAKSFGISTFVVYTYISDGIQSYLTSWIKCAEKYGIQVVLQVFPDASQDLDMQVEYFHDHMMMENVVGFYLVDEPTPATVPIAVQSSMISKVRAVRNLTVYGATNQDAFTGDKYIHKDIDYIFMSVYAYFHANIYIGYQYYTANCAGVYEENGIRKGRVIPLLTTYNYTDEGTPKTEDEIHSGNCYWIERFQKVAFWQFYTQHPGGIHKVIENDKACASMARRATRKIQDTSEVRTILIDTRNGLSFSAETDRYNITGSSKKYLFDWYKKESSVTIVSSGADDGSFLITTSGMLIFDFHDEYNLEYVRFNCHNQFSQTDRVVYRLVINPIELSTTLTTDLEFIGSADVIFAIPEALANKTKQIGLYIVSRSEGTTGTIAIKNIRIVASKILNQSR